MSLHPKRKGVKGGGSSGGGGSVIGNTSTTLGQMSALPQTVADFDVYRRLRIPFGTDMFDGRTDTRIAFCEGYAGTDSTTITNAEITGIVFTALFPGAIGSVGLKMFRVGSPGTITYRLYATSAGLPTGAALATGTLDGDTLTTSTTGAMVFATLTGVSLANDTMYAVTLQSALYTAGTVYAAFIRGD